jgi:nitric oxide reductase large subunit
MKRETMKLIILLLAAVAFEIWILNEASDHFKKKRIERELLWKKTPTDQEINEIENGPQNTKHNAE